MADKYLDVSEETKSLLHAEFGKYNDRVKEETERLIEHLPKKVWEFDDLLREEFCLGACQEKYISHEPKDLYARRRIGSKIKNIDVICGIVAAMSVPFIFCESGLRILSVVSFSIAMSAFSIFHILTGDYVIFLASKILFAINFWL